MVNNRDEKEHCLWWEPRGGTSTTCRDKIEHCLWWDPRGGTSTTWFDNWTNIGPLFMQQFEVQTCHPLTDISKFLNVEGWNYEVMQDKVPRHVVRPARENMDCIFGRHCE